MGRQNLIDLCFGPLKWGATFKMLRTTVRDQTDLTQKDASTGPTVENSCTPMTNQQSYLAIYRF